MDSEHRHELKENDLGNAVISIKEFWGKHTWRILLGTAVIASAIIFVRTTARNTVIEHENTWFTLNTEADPVKLMVIAREADAAGARVAANMRVANQLLATSMNPTPANTTEPLTDEKRMEMAEQAATFYKAVINETESTVLRFNATLALATIAENRSQWDAAATHYDAIIKSAEGNKGLGWYSQQARMRKAQLARIQEPIVWGKEKLVLPKPLIDPTDILNPKLGPLGEIKPDPNGVSPIIHPEKPTTDGTKPATDGKKSTGDDKPATGDAKSGADGKKPATDVTKPAADDKKPAAGKSPSP